MNLLTGNTFVRQLAIEAAGSIIANLTPGDDILFPTCICLDEDDLAAIRHLFKIPTGTIFETMGCALNIRLPGPKGEEKPGAVALAWTLITMFKTGIPYTGFRPGDTILISKDPDEIFDLTCGVYTGRTELWLTIPGYHHRESDSSERLKRIRRHIPKEGYGTQI